jgi:hypothetical protein
VRTGNDRTATKEGQPTVNPLAIACAVLAVNSAPFTTTMSTSGHTPKINTKWAYTIKVVDPAGKPIAATISAVVVDPIGGIHPVQLAGGGSTPGKVLTNYPIRGTLSSTVVWPVTSRGYPLIFRVVVRSAGAKRTIKYTVTPR